MIPEFADAFKFVDTFGLPLHIVMQKVSENGLACNLSKFIEDAIASGWKKEKAISMCNEAVNLLRSYHCNFYL